MRVRNSFFVARALSMLMAAACSGGSGTKTATPAPQAAATAAASPANAATAAAGPKAGAYRAEPALEGLDVGPVTGLYPVPGEDGFAYLLEKSGTIRQVSLNEADQSQQAQVRVLDLTSRLIQPQDTEEGLLGLAFAPDFTTSRKIYVNYTQGNPRRDTVSRFVVPTSGEIDVSSEQKLLEIADFAPNHNGGGMQFGPDGMLYIGFGDGGGGGDPQGNGQKTDVLLGKILRIDVSADGAYTVPPDNPFAGQDGKRGEIWAYGLRNPWRFDFDDETGTLWVADVGQGTWEEVDEVTKGGNYGWNIMEGPVCYKPSSGCDETGLILPRASYSHDDGSCSITGGFVYRGQALPELRGWFVYGDFCSKKVWAVNTRGPGEPVQLTTSGAGITAFGEDASGELYLLGFTGQQYKLVAGQ
jgi:glucose/arabinose dehydrogenase